MLETGRYEAEFSATSFDDFTAWVRSNRGEVDVWWYRMPLVRSGKYAARFAVRAPVVWGALPAPKLLN